MINRDLTMLSVLRDIHIDILSATVVYVRMVLCTELNHQRWDTFSSRSLGGLIIDLNDLDLCYFEL